MVEDIVEENKWYVQFFLIEDSEASFRVLTKLLTFDIVLGGPVGKEDRSVEGLIPVDRREVLHSCVINEFVCLIFLILRDKTVLEQAQGLMCLDTYKTFDRQRF
jgi:hypothetical protein